MDGQESTRSQVDAQPRQTAPERDQERADWSELPALTDDSGRVHISEEVVAAIAGIAAMEVDGVAGMSGGIVGGISEILGKRNLSRGVRVSLGKKETTLDLNLIVHYGVRIPRIAERVQEAVKTAVESMTGLQVVAVNIHVQGVAFQSGEIKEANS